MSEALISSTFKSKQVDALVPNSTLVDEDLIEIIDPAHPLYGRRFHVVRLCQPLHEPGFVDVRYREYIRLRILLSATNQSTSHLALLSTKLTLEAIQQLIALVKEYQPSCLSHPLASGLDCPTL